MAFKRDPLSLPSEPLLAAVAARGGLRALLPRDLAAENPPECKPGRRNAHTEPVAPEYRREYERCGALLLRASKRGTIQHQHADEFICTHLGVHPYEVYGEAWWDSTVGGLV